MTDIIQEVAKRLESANIEYMFTGSTAMNFYAIPRMTRDVDIVVELKEADAQKICSLFEKDFYIDLAMILDAIKSRSMFNIIHYESVFKVDFIVKKAHPYRIEEFKRKRKINFEGMDIFIVAPEDLIISKLMWIKETMSEQQIKDIKNIFQSVKSLDLAYIDRWTDCLEIKGIYYKVKP